MTITNEEEIALLLKTAIPIDDVDQMLSPGLNFAIVWVDISDRPDLQALSQEEPLEEGYSICTWFYDNPWRHNMRIGLHIEMRQPVRFVLPLVFQMSRYIDQLTTISQEGNLWIVPGPPPAHLTGSSEMDLAAIMGNIVAYSGQGLFITLQDHMVVELRERLAERKHLK
jgi:hypothetical protein